MLSLESIEQSITELESRDTSFANCERLAWLYIVHDHLKGYNVSPEAIIEMNGSSDFIKMVNGKNPSKIMPVLDELMDAVKMLHPALYDAAMQKLKEV